MRYLTITIMFVSAFYLSNLYAGGAYYYSRAFQYKVPKAKVDGDISVRLDRALFGNHVIDRDFYGSDLHAFSPLPNKREVNPLSLSKFKSGGNYHSVYNWKENVYYDHYYNLFYNVEPIMERFDYVKEQYNADMMVQVNMLGTWPEITADGNLVVTNGADAAAAGLEILDFNKTNKKGLKYVLMGNEPFEWHNTHAPVWDRDPVSADEYIDRFIRFAISIRDSQKEATGNSNDIEIWGPEIASGWNGWQTNNLTECRYDNYVVGKLICSYGNGEFKKFVPYFLNRLKKAEADRSLNPNGYNLLDVLTLHYYPLFRKEFQDPSTIITDSNGKEDIKSMLLSTAVWNDKSFVNRKDFSSPRGSGVDFLGDFKKWRDIYYPSAKLAVTEYGIDSAVVINYHKIVRPLYLADLIGRVATSGYSTFIKSFLNSPINTGDENDWSLIDRDGKNKRDMYHVYKLFTQNYLGSVLGVNDSYGRFVNGYASFSDKNGKKYINLIVVNKDAVEHVAKINFYKPSLDKKQFVLEAKLAPWSVTLFKVNASRTGSSIKVARFGAYEMEIPVDPYYAADK